MITDQDGKVRLTFDPSSKKVEYDLLVAPCGDTYCDDSETCSSCEEDCGKCLPPLCGSNIFKNTQKLNVLIKIFQI